MPPCAAPPRNETVGEPERARLLFPLVSKLDGTVPNQFVGYRQRQMALRSVVKVRYEGSAKRSSHTNLGFDNHTRLTTAPCTSPTIPRRRSQGPPVASTSMATSRYVASWGTTRSTTFAASSHLRSATFSRNSGSCSNVARSVGENGPPCVRWRQWRGRGIGGRGRGSWWSGDRRERSLTTYLKHEGRLGRVREASEVFGARAREPPVVPSQSRSISPS